MATKIRKTREKERKYNVGETECSRPSQLNPKYIGMNKEEKDKAIKLNYYKNGKGQMYYAKRTRIKRYDIPKERFDNCKSIDELNKVVFQVLKERNYSDKIIEQLTIHIMRKRKYDTMNEVVSEEAKEVVSEEASEVVSEVDTIVKEVVDEIIEKALEE